MTTTECETCQAQLFAFADNELDSTIRPTVEQHLHTCDECQEALASIWQMQRAASHWQDQRVPPRHAYQSPFQNDRMPWFAGFGLQWATSLASVVVLVLVLTEARVSTVDGFTVEFGSNNHYVSATELQTNLISLQKDQAELLQASLNELNTRQVTTNQLLLRTLLETSREERREDLQNVLVLLDSVQAERDMSTEESLRFLIASQRRDREEIQEINNALLQVNNRNY